MPIDLNEYLVRLAEASKIFPGNPHIATIWRWRSKGVKGHKLETVCVGGRLFTSREAIERFIAASTAAANPSKAAAVTTKVRQRQLAEADQILREAGI